MADRLQGQHIVPIELYDSYVAFVFGDVENIEELEIPQYAKDAAIEYLNDVEVDESKNPAKGFTLEIGEDDLVIYIPHFRFSESYSHGTLSHEIGHAVYIILRDRGLTLTDSSQEAYMYLGGFITEKIYRYILDMVENRTDD